MKELDIEEKARRYDEAIERAKKVLLDCTSEERKVVEYISPELAESDGERIRKALLEMVHDTTVDSLWVDYNVHKDDCLAWLEKQGQTFTKKDVDDAYLKGVCDTKQELEKQGEHAKFLDSIQVGDKVTRNQDGVLVNLSQLKRVAKPALDIEVPFGANDSELQEASYHIPEGFHAEIDSNRVVIKRCEQKPVEPQQYMLSQEKYAKAVDECVYGEQKPADKVEPKFHEGDWIIGDKDNSVHQVKTVIENISNGKYAYDLIDGGYISTSHESDYHLWTIQEAKAGDVLYLQKDGKEHIIIYRGVIKERFRTFVSAYCAYNGIVDAFCFADVSRYVDIAYGGIMPATKEQRELLFQKMKEEGYEWDADKKELKKIVQRPQSTWKPSDEQMRALNYVVNIMASSESPKENDYYFNVFKDLREQLKKLREK